MSARIRPSSLVLALGVAAATLWPAVAGAQPAPPQPISPPPELAALRARFEPMTPQQVEAAGYVVPAPECVSAPPGGMGYHAINFGVHQQQFRAGRMDPANPPILLIGGDGKVIGVEWETNQNAPKPQTLFGRDVQVLPGHPGLEEPHYMLHVYFRPNNQVLVADFDPEVKCPPPGTWPTGFAQRAPAGPPAAAPAQLPRTGGAPLGLFAGVSALLAVGGLVLRRARSH
jgi:LPXTG-motif cell wall-anchored protein